ncbi:GntR family transcriptional regulator [Streptomyces sp. NPDC020490]|uniref:GntR family transcriptional regulator n=1 Tax=Streptomyces sp. NPDC020490 TaxID=3365078 RepID=UPI0037BC7E40
MTPKWQQLADELADEIRSGKRLPGSTLPFIPELVAAGRGSKATIHQAYKELEARGLVAPHRGRGTIVLDRSQPRVTLSRYERTLTPGDFSAWESTTAAQGLDGRTEAGTPPVEILDAPADVAEFLALPTGTPAACRRHRAMIKAEVVGLCADWYPLDIAQAAGLDRSDHGEGGALGALVGAGIIPAEAEEFLTAEDATPEQAAQLGLGARASVLLVDRVTRDTTGRAVELARFIGPAHRLRLAYSPLPLSVTGYSGT